MALLLTILLVVVGFIIWFVVYKVSKPTPVSTTAIVTSNSDPITEEPNTGISENQFDAIKLQSVIDDWTTSVDGTSSVVIADVDGNILASSNPNQVYFAASLYKLYVAYAGYQQVDAGLVDPSEIYVDGYTRAECLDLMIRESYSPCAEKLWNELGKAELTQQLETYGIMGTSMTNITTTANDSAIILARIARGEGLSEESQTAYLSSMKDQDSLYRRGLPSGFNTLTVYNKVGWNEQNEWHDGAVVELANGQKLVVVVMSENVGSANIARLGSAIEEAISQ